MRRATKINYFCYLLSTIFVLLFVRDLYNERACAFTRDKSYCVKITAWIPASDAADFYTFLNTSKGD